MGTRTVEVSEEFITGAITTGRKLGDQGIITCAEGLPEGARLLSVGIKKVLLHGPQTIVAVFAHPDWHGHCALMPTFTLTANEGIAQAIIDTHNVLPVGLSELLQQMPKDVEPWDWLYEKFSNLLVELWEIQNRFPPRVLERVGSEASNEGDP